MGNRAAQAATKAARSTVGFAARRIASSEWLMSIVYDHMNETNFAGLAEHEEIRETELPDDAKAGMFARVALRGQFDPVRHFH